ncbi:MULTISPECIES: hypothetical protein [Streptomyces]|uniref:Uncharacterized protein n=2 Tax=Streptomyces TaxID=1883 RepID=A0ABV9J3H4_9ACTN
MDVIDLAAKVGTGALGGAAASLFLAGYVAQRQERGKLLVIFGELTITCAEELAMPPAFNSNR